MISPHVLLDDGLSASGWGASLKMLISILVLFLVGIVAFIWWVKRG
jgi:hypothetical protein